MRKTLLAAALGALVAAPAAAFDLTSADIAPGAQIDDAFVANVFGCEGGNTSPELSWSGAPAETKSFALMVHDPDAPTGGAGFWHWIVLDIPGSTTSLAQGAGADDAALPDGAHHVTNDYGADGWGGPCPPEADAAHRYDFTLYALPVEKLEVPEGASKAVIGFLVNANAIGSATLQGLYDR